ncbi:Protein of unknown function (DUF2631) [Streptoalloteichus tenebrarius]|uniref:DUF2631 domain-containing protein n=1 Tax=Streptoalloteichus tenebrarius (strain ATCC 17920 / DSM 40477 / JCM 4838 / CBS 697.72 / NBRC 16177 / NCIMB 11028 / NRRL B-12390 / A12253. 1 / ISP 5477) TaxID=1933 RepID=A0ABT1HZ39_STRSD|nr:DUF2631 domain-containing protein [Streptoalloteichus tenebrarius]MCP2260783.1 Protein of unknown function (DUF2631) [Streptoalloteichus tenebrarius]BFF03401.1 DUF2631 domain-containing protein [Streptoalloteichus tenebrarius]
MATVSNSSNSSRPSTAELEQRRAVTELDLEQEPSAEWGWHGTFPRATQIAGWFTAAVMLLMLIGNHRGRVEDVFLVLIAVTMAFMLVRDIVKRRTHWRR